MDQKLNNSNLWDGKKQKWIKDILSKSGTELKELTEKNGIEKCLINYLSFYF